MPLLFANLKDISSGIYNVFIKSPYNVFILSERFGNEDGIPATYQVIYFIGWKPDPSQVNDSLILCILETPKGVLWQTVKTLMKCSIMLHFIRVFIVFKD